MQGECFVSFARARRDVESSARRPWRMMMCEHECVCTRELPLIIDEYVCVCECACVHIKCLIACGVEKLYVFTRDASMRALVCVNHL